MKILSERLKEMREFHNLTQQQLGDKIGFNRTSISDWERDRTEPNMETLVMIAKIFGVSTDYLLGIEN